MAWDFATDPAFDEHLEWMRTFVREEIQPLELITDEVSHEAWHQLTAPLKQQVKERGLWAAHLDPELGGQGFGQVKLALMHQILGRSGPAPAIFGNQAPDSGNSELIAIGATEEQKVKWLWPLLAGEITSSFALTEPHSAGSDPTNIRTTAVRDGDEYVIDGHKWYASMASVADFVLVMAVTNPDEQRHRAASFFVVEKGTPGMNIVRDVPTMHHPYPGRFRAGGHAEIVFEDCRVPAANRIGGEGDGFVLAQKRLNGGRIHHAMRWVGMCERAFDMMAERAVSRQVGGQLLAERQLVQEMVADSATEIRALKLLTLHAAWTWDTYGPSRARVEIAQVKYWGAKVLHDVVDRAIQVNGALGYSADLPLESMYRIARNFRISDGADEVHKSFVARKMLKDYTPVEGYPTEHIPTRRAAVQERFAAYLDHAAAND